NQNTICGLPFLVFIFATLLTSIISRSQCPDWPVQATVSEGANFAFRTCSNARFR
ncbi:hypothetical protein K443DRAFT_43720, partial [Laccaria amethystina LaAM-08-1]